MGDGQEPADVEATAVPWSPRRRRTFGVLSGVVVLALLVFVPGPVSGILKANNARQLVDDVSTGRAKLLAKQDEFRPPLASLGNPARSWTQVSCWMSPRYSDGDGEQDVVMFYWQQCALLAYEIYALPPDAGDAAQVAQRLRGHSAGEPSCAEPLFDVLTPDVGASRIDEFATGLWWMNPEGVPPSHQPDRCTMPTPDDPDTAHTQIGIDARLGADAYVVYQVRSPVSMVDVGCDRRLSWLAPCRGEPEGFPTL
ncbi:hypothetical protein ABFW00_12370 [Mycobacteroides abscessus]|uniref:hypothetical protein n=1 Tax=Mycobacteroides abscessus TaxID=36809 RepID=UPI00266B3F71|nr:hypothetical protein [Mycobacteroides abscessus]MDO3338913.1 hypothetical protein [Mycobacteroides abscessus subsp. abscessus]